MGRGLAGTCPVSSERTSRTRGAVRDSVCTCSCRHFNYRGEEVAQEFERLPERNRSLLVCGARMCAHRRRWGWQSSLFEMEGWRETARLRRKDRERKGERAEFGHIIGAAGVLTSVRVQALFSRNHHSSRVSLALRAAPAHRGGYRPRRPGLESCVRSKRDRGFLDSGAEALCASAN